jgi:hypothetical protein
LASKTTSETDDKWSQLAVQARVGAFSKKVKNADFPILEHKALAAKGRRLEAAGKPKSNLKSRLRRWLRRGKPKEKRTSETRPSIC